MFGIYHQFPVFASADRVFEAVSTVEGLDAWWTLSSKGTPKTGEIYELFFGEGYDWRARVSTCVPGKIFALSIYDSMPDWENTFVRFGLTERANSNGGVMTDVSFSHTGWQERSEHFRTSSFCWAMYLRLMKKYAEEGAVVEYAKRLDA